VTLVFAGTSLGFGLYARSLAVEFNRVVLERNGTTDPARRMTLERRGYAIADAVDRNNTLAYITGGLAGVAGAVTLGFLLFWPRATPARSTRTVWLLPAPDGLTLAGRF
jgi:hypothetical protein